MGGLAFSLNQGVNLKENSQGFFLVSRTPLRLVKINRSLFNVLRQIAAGSDLSEIAAGFPDSRPEQLLTPLLKLTAGGYLKLIPPAALTEYPLVSIIIPARNQSELLKECLTSLTHVVYPSEKLEVIVVLDGDSDGVSGFSPALDVLNIQFLKLETSSGPATARNTGAARAAGEILAFLDADCASAPNWLQEMVPLLYYSKIGIVGGLVEGYYHKSRLDRYEAVSSSLNMGRRLLFGGADGSTVYVPTCNMLVKRKAFQSAGGFKDGLRVGEDVDFCWRIRNLGFDLLYVPFGQVFHKHRGRLSAMLRRRFDYGTSESMLYRSHKEKRKHFALPLWNGLIYLAVSLAILFLSPYPLAAIPFFLAAGVYQKSRSVKRFQFDFGFSDFVFSTLRSNLSFTYIASFHLMRYYLILLVFLGFLFYPVWYFSLFIVLMASIADYFVKKPRLVYPVFLFYYVLEQVFYQSGVFCGCLKLGYFGSYLPEFEFSYST